MPRQSRLLTFSRSLIWVAVALAWPCSPAQANYRAKATELTDAIQRAYYDGQKGLYRPDFPVKPTGLDYEVMWGNGVQFSALNGAEKSDPDKYRPILYAFAKGLTKYWDTGVKPPGFDAYFSSPKGDDKYYDDNAWLVLGFTEAYRNTKDPAFLDWARQVQNFVLSGWDDKLGGGIYWYQNKKNSKNTCINAPAIVGALALYQISGQQSDLDSAVKIYNWTMAHLQDKDGLFLDNIDLNGKITDWKFTYNTGLMIRANLDLWKVTKDEKYLTEARREADASLLKWLDPQTGAFADSARFSHLLAEALLQCYDATKDLKYLNAVRRHADFGYRYVRDVRNGLYFNKWDSVNRSDRDPKELIENSAAARLFWLLVPYQDVEELRANAEDAEKKGDHATAVGWYQQIQASTAGAANTQPLVPPDTMNFRSSLFAVAGILLLIPAAAFSKSMPLNVMTFNLRYASATPPNAWSARRQVTSACIQQAAPDLIGTQEGFYDQIQDIAQDRPEYGWIGDGREGGSRGEFTAVFYRKERLRPLEYDHFWLSDTPEVIGSKSWGNRVIRMTTWVKFRDLKTQREFYFWNTHLDHEFQNSREKSAALILERINKLDTKLPIILGGDFNVESRANPVYDTLIQGGFTDTWFAAEKRLGQNYASFHDYKKPVPDGPHIDWILTRGAVKAESAQIVSFEKGGQYPSDHFPVMTTLDF